MAASLFEVVPGADDASLASATFAVVVPWPEPVMEGSTPIAAPSVPQPRAEEEVLCKLVEQGSSIDGVLPVHGKVLHF